MNEQLRQEGLELLAKAPAGKWEWVRTAHEPEAGLEGGEIQLWAEVPPDEDDYRETEIRTLVWVDHVSEDVTDEDMDLMVWLRNNAAELLGATER